MKKTDIIVALVIGELIALLNLGIFKNLELKTEWIFLVWPVFLPIFCLFCLWLASVISKKIRIIWQAAKFLLVGILNFFVDQPILILLFKMILFLTFVLCFLKILTIPLLVPFLLR